MNLFQSLKDQLVDEIDHMIDRRDFPAVVAIVSAMSDDQFKQLCIFRSEYKLRTAQLAASGIKESK